MAIQALASIVDEQSVSKICSTCRSTFETPAVIARIVPDCPDCMRRLQRDRLEAWRRRELEALPQLLDEKLGSCGLSIAERGADVARVPLLIKRALPEAARRLVSAAAIDAAFRGFGLTGGQGIGKSFCLAAMLRRRLELKLRASIDETSHVPDPWPGDAPWHALQDFAWVNWPEGAGWLKRAVADDGGSAEVRKRLGIWKAVPLLVLDDLGRERVARGAPGDDYAVGCLDELIDARSRAARPVLWTSNLAPAALARRYGGALTSRLLGLAPAVVLASAADLRLER